MNKKTEDAKTLTENTATQHEILVDAHPSVNVPIGSRKISRDLILTHKEALAGSPDDNAACGEEDIGAGLEFLVTQDDATK